MKLISLLRLISPEVSPTSSWSWWVKSRAWAKIMKTYFWEIAFTFYIHNLKFLMVLGGSKVSERAPCVFNIKSGSLWASCWLEQCKYRCKYKHKYKHRKKYTWQVITPFKKHCAPNDHYYRRCPSTKQPQCIRCSWFSSNLNFKKITQKR